MNDLDDAAFELPTDNLIQPMSIFNLEYFEAPDNAAERPADQEMQEEIRHAWVDPNLQRHPSPEPQKGSPAKTDEYQSIKEQAENLHEFQEVERYQYNGGDSDSEYAPEDSDGEDEAEINWEKTSLVTNLLKISLRYAITSASQTQRA